MFEKRSDLVRFLAVVETGKILEAADNLAITQPALTRIISKLESQFGGRLFERLPTGVRPTGLGQMAADLSRHILTEIEVAEEKITWTVSGRNGALRLTAGPMWMQAVLPAAISRFRKLFPGIELKLRTTCFAEGMRRLISGESDFHCGGAISNERLPSFLGRDPFVRMTAGIVAGRDHPLQSQDISLEELANYPWIDYDPPLTVRTGKNRHSLMGILDSLYEHTGKRVSSLVRSGSTGLFLMMTGPYLAWLPLTFLERLPDVFLRALPVEFGRISYRSGITFRRSAEDLQPLRSFKGILKEVALNRES